MSSPSTPPPALTTMASAMLFGAIMFATTALTVKSFLLRDYRAFRAAQNPRAMPLDVDSFTSLYTFLYHMSVFGLILFYAYICEYHPPFPHAIKSYDRDMFFFLTALLFVASFFTLKRNKTARASSDAAVSKSPKRGSPTINSNNLPTKEKDNDNNDTSKTFTTEGLQQNGADSQQQHSIFVGSVEPVDEATDVLNRDQTEEWKGWMQFMFLLYHYYHAEEGDYSSIRVMQMLWRLNFLVLFLCLTQGTTYILYYICLLHTYYFLMVYVTMRVAKDVNYSRMGIRIKLAIVALIIYVVWDLDSGGLIFRKIHLLFLSEHPMLGATSGAMWEWYFRSSLDHFSTFLGMVFALNYPITSLFFRKLEAQPLHKHVVAKALVGVVFLAATVVWAVGPFRQEKLHYNATHAYFAFIPLLSYIYFRNLTPWLRSNTLDLLHQIGKSTLETYLMQHHIWLTSDAKSLLTIIPGYPKINFLLVSLIYVICSRRLYQLTLFLRGMLLPNNRNVCIRNLGVLFGVIGTFLGLSFILRIFHLLNLVTVLLCSVLFGLVTYQLVLQLSWQAHHDSADVSSTRYNTSKSAINQSSVFPYLSALLAVLALGGVVLHMSRNGASKILSLPESCSAFVQKGEWILVDACNEESRGALYRKQNIENIGTCSPQSNIHAWGWEANPSHTHCRFVQRDSKSLLQTLNHRNLTFVGDSVVRHLYHATCRQVGDSSAGSYNTSMEKWTDYSKSYKNAALEFRWAPYAEDLTLTIKNIQQNLHKPDLVVLGGGAWDRLHKYNNESDQSFYISYIKTLVSQIIDLRETGVSVVWVVPTTINTWALLTAEKVANIREDQMAELRELQAQSGILEAASFVLDGPSFTAKRVLESYDGVHYPLAVYDGGAQILANALDWLLPGDPILDPFVAPHPGSMSNAKLGFFLLCFVFMGLFFMDGFLGVSYFASLVVPSVGPLRLYEEAFTLLHKENALPVIPAQSNGLLSSSEKAKVSIGDTDPELNEEKVAFL